MPLLMVTEDLAAGRLVQVKLEGPGLGILPMQAIYKSDDCPVRQRNGCSNASARAQLSNFAPAEVCGITARRLDAKETRGFVLNLQPCS